MRILPFLLLLPAVAQADTLAETHFPLNFCYQQSFDSYYLSDHPDEPVRRISLRRERAGTLQHLGSLAMTVSVSTRDGGRDFEALARCDADRDGLACRMDRRAGGFELKAQGDQIVLTVSSEGMLFENRFNELRLEPGEDSESAYPLRRCG